MRPPLDLTVEITAANGTQYRLEPTSSQAANRPSGIGFTTKRGEGDSTASLHLPRRLDLDYPDQGLFNDVTLTGADGTVAWQGRLARPPRSMDQTHSVGLECVGYVADLKFRPVHEIYVDRRTGQWTSAPFDEQVRLTAVAYSSNVATWQAGLGGLTIILGNGATIPANYDVSTWYLSPPGVKVAKIQYKGADTSLPTNDGPYVWSTDGLIITGSETVNLTLDSTVRTATFSQARRNVAVHLSATGGPTAIPTTGAARRLDVIAAFGDSAIPTIAVSGQADGVAASNVIAHIVGKYAPTLSITGINATSYPISHLVFDGTSAYDAILQTNKHHLWNLGCKGRDFFYEPFDLTDYDWEIRLDDPGVTVQLQGDSTDDLANSMDVDFTNVLTGMADRVTADDYTDLKDTSETNPANMWGLDKRTTISLTQPTTPEAAVNIGRAVLTENNLPKAPGTIGVVGHIRDRAGNWQPAWKVRAGETIAITNHPNDRPRLIVETSYDHDAKRVSIAVDQGFRTTEAFFDRLDTDSTR